MCVFERVILYFFFFFLVGCTYAIRIGILRVAYFSCGWFVYEGFPPFHLVSLCSFLSLEMLIKKTRLLDFKCGVFFFTSLPFVVFKSAYDEVKFHIECTYEYVTRK